MSGEPLLHVLEMTFLRSNSAKGQRKRSVGGAAALPTELLAAGWRRDLLRAARREGAAILTVFLRRDMEKSTSTIAVVRCGFFSAQRNEFRNDEVGPDE